MASFAGTIKDNRKQRMSTAHFSKKEAAELETMTKYNDTLAIAQQKDRDGLLSQIKQPEFLGTTAEGRGVVGSATPHVTFQLVVFSFVLLLSVSTSPYVSLRSQISRLMRNFTPYSCASSAPSCRAQRRACNSCSTRCSCACTTLSCPTTSST
jgi:hypothetical protein